jgi:hypothetical protein
VEDEEDGPVYAHVFNINHNKIVLIDKGDDEDQEREQDALINKAVNKDKEGNANALDASISLSLSQVLFSSILSIPLVLFQALSGWMLNYDDSGQVCRGVHGCALHRFVLRMERGMKRDVHVVFR